MTSASPVDPVIGRLIDGRYEVRSRIARGGMATVYLATDIRLERRVAIKVMHGHLSDDSTFTARFIQEARSAARLAHPNVVSVFDQGQDDDIAYLVMEHLPGITLRELLRDHGRLTAGQVVDIMDAIASGLAAAHRAGIVHRDLKPENVLLADDGRIKIGDFGLARAVSAHTSTGQALLGTIAYLSPELVTRGMADARSDIYALGIMMYEMLSGAQPYRGEQPMQIAYQHANESVPRPSAVAQGVPDALDDLVLWTTEREPDERPANAGELLERLREIEGQLGIGSAATRRTVALPHGVAASEPQLDETTMLEPNTSSTDVVDPDDDVAALTQSGRRRARRGLWLLLAVLVLAIGAGGVGWYFGDGPGSYVPVPAVAGLGADEASEVLGLEEFGVDRSSDYSLDVASGSVIRSEPGEGDRVRKGETVTLIVSQGARPVSIDALAGLSVGDATERLERIGLVAGEIGERFSADVEAGTVLSATQPSDGADLTDGGDTVEGETVDLLVSAGQVPDVADTSVEDATSALTDAGLQVDDERQERYSESVGSGRVMGIVDALNEDGSPAARRPGDAVTLIVSIGRPPVEVPDVVGENVADARDTLRDLGFDVDVDTALPESFWGIAGLMVEEMDPGAGEEAADGSTITLTASL